LKYKLAKPILAHCLSLHSYRQTPIENCPISQTGSYPAYLAVNGFIEELSYEDRTLSGGYPKAWIAITLPESILIRRVRAFTNKVKYELVIFGFFSLGDML